MVRIIINKIIIRHLTSQSGHQCLGRGVGASTDDVSTLSYMGGVVRTMGTTADALPLGMIRTY
jgi:hypothetical protein